MKQYAEKAKELQTITAPWYSRVNVGRPNNLREWIISRFSLDSGTSISMDHYHSANQIVSTTITELTSFIEGIDPSEEALYTDIIEKAKSEKERMERIQ